MARRAIHPGNHLAEELKALEMSAAELARNLKVPTNRVTAILNGQRAITGDTALRLGHAGAAVVAQVGTLAGAVALLLLPRLAAPLLGERLLLAGERAHAEAAA